MTLTRAGIIEELYKSIGLSRNESAELLETIFEEIVQSFEKNQKVKITSFGTFNLRYKKERIGRNPKTGEEASITPRTVVSFKPSSNIKNLINIQIAKKV